MVLPMYELAKQMGKEDAIAETQLRKAKAAKNQAKRDAAAGNRAVLVANSWKITRKVCTLPLRTTRVRNQSFAFLFLAFSYACC